MALTPTKPGQKKVYIREARKLLLKSLPGVSCNAIDFIFEDTCNFNFTEAYRRLSEIQSNQTPIEGAPSINVFLKTPRKAGRDEKITNADLLGEIASIPELNANGTRVKEYRVNCSLCLDAGLKMNGQGGAAGGYIVCESCMVKFLSMHNVNEENGDESSKVSEVAKERAKAEEAFVGLAGDSSDSILASDFDKLIESLGTVYCEEEHRHAIKKISTLDASSGNKIVSKKAFINWYLDWLFGDGESESEGDAAKTTEVKAEGWGSMFKVSEEGSWKCEVCMVTNALVAKASAACETTKPGEERKSAAGGGSVTAGASTGSISAGSAGIGAGGFSFGALATDAKKDCGAIGFSFPASSAGTSSFVNRNTSNNHDAVNGTTASGFGISAGGGASLGTAPTQARIGVIQTDGFSFGRSKPAASSGFGAPFAAASGTKWDGTGGFTPQCSSGPLFGQATAASTFGPHGRDPPEAPGTSAVPFHPTLKQDGNQSVLMHSITAMSQYEGKSFEELRMEDYLARNKGRGSIFLGSHGGPENKERGSMFYDLREFEKYYDSLYD